MIIFKLQHKKKPKTCHISDKFSRTRTVYSSRAFKNRLPHIYYSTPQSSPQAHQAIRPYSNSVFRQSIFSHRRQLPVEARGAAAGRPRFVISLSELSPAGTLHLSPVKRPLGFPLQLMRWMRIGDENRHRSSTAGRAGPPAPTTAPKPQQLQCLEKGSPPCPGEWEGATQSHHELTGIISGSVLAVKPESPEKSILL